MADQVWHQLVPCNGRLTIVQTAQAPGARGVWHKAKRAPKQRTVTREQLVVRGVPTASQECHTDEERAAFRASALRYFR